MTAPDKPRRRVTDEERALWQAVTRSISPLKHKRRAAVPVADATPSKPKADVKVGARRPASAVAAPALPRSKPKPQEPALAPLERRERQRLARGTEAIEARLDLHGRTQSQAHATLLRFLRKAQAEGAKTVLVITGKGGGLDGERGVLKRQVPLWLSLPEFRSLVVGFGDAGIGHGGEGALYVRVRRGR